MIRLVVSSTSPRRSASSSVTSNWSCTVEPPLLGHLGGGTGLLLNCSSLVVAPDPDSDPIGWLGHHPTRHEAPPCRVGPRQVDSGQRARTFSAWGPLGPCVTSNSTFWFSSRDL